MVENPETPLKALRGFVKLNRACMSVNRFVHAHLAEHNLTPTQFGVLDALVHLGPLTVSVLACKILCSQNSLSSVIDTMEKSQLVMRERSATDRRVVLVSLTDAGRDRFNQVWPDHLVRITVAFDVLTGPELQELERLLRKLGRRDYSEMSTDSSSDR
jgi:MarR family 2-MHQ and catechol resistance regulon transcriptional repressor